MAALLAVFASLWQVLGPLLVPLLQALAAQAVKPTTATVQQATPADAAASDRASATLTTFPGIRLGLVVLACVLSQGCFGQRVIMPAPAIPVRLAEDVRGVLVFVKAPDGTWHEATTDLHAGEVITYDPDFWTLQRVAEGAHFTSATPAVPTLPAK